MPFKLPCDFTLISYGAPYSITTLLHLGVFNLLGPSDAYAAEALM